MPRLLMATVLASLLGVIGGPADAQIVEGARSTREYLELGTQHFEQLLPDFEQETVRGTGYKPFMRYKWFMEQRLGTDDDLRPGARWEAFQRLQDLYAEQGRGGFPTWFQLGPTNVAGRCLAIEVHPTNANIAYAGFAAGGIWKTTDGGVNWTPLGDDLPSMAVGAIEIDASNPNRMWIGTGEGWGNIDAVHGVGVLVSLDAGLTWSPTAYTATLAEVRDVFEVLYNPITGTLLVAADNGIWRSTDGGDSFAAQMTGGLWKDLELKTNSTQTYYAVMHGVANPGFYVSTDDGLSWTRTTTGTPTSSIGNSRIAQSAADPDAVWWLIAHSGTGMTLGLYASTDGGASFSLLSTQNFFASFGQGWYDLTIAVDPEDVDNIFVGGVEFFRSTNGGTSFSSFASNVHVDHHASTWAPSDPNALWIGSDGGVYRSTNSGASFISRNNGLVTLQYYAMGNSWADPNIAYGGTQDNGTWKYTGATTHTSVLGGDGFECETGRVDVNFVLAEYFNGNHQRSLNGGSTWFGANTGIVENGPWQTPTHMDYTNESILWTAHTQRIYRSTNKAASWTTTFTGSLSGGARSIDQSLNNPNRVYVASPTKVYVSTDNGVSWTEKAITGGFPTANAVTDIAVHPDDPDLIVLSLGSYSAIVPRVIKSTDAGDTWTDITNNLPGEGCQSIEIDHNDPNRYYLGTDLGVYISFDAGGTWTPMNVGLPHTVCDDVRLHPDGFLRVATHGRGMWEVDVSGIAPTSVGDGIEVTIEPLTLRVLGNPASERASVRFGLREAGDIRLALYDVNGRMVRMLADRPAGATVDFVEIDVRDLSAGVYFARLDANGHSITQKLVVER